MTDDRTPEPASPCCAPGGAGATGAGPGDAPADGSHAAVADDPPAGSTPERIVASLVAIDRATFSMGSEPGEGYTADGEEPAHDVEIGPYSIARYTVTNADFDEFAQATGYTTLAEREGWSFVFGGLLPDDFPPTRGVAAAPWWRQVEGSDWRHPEGPQSDIADRADHPVVHVTWDDAAAFCRWSGTRLPTEAEWERAARGGLVRRRFPWGDELEPGGEHRMNVFQGTFPGQNTVADGYAGTCPVDAFEPNGFGLHNTTGNVWEWCADWFHPHTYLAGHSVDPTGPPTGTHRVMRGGSYLCHDSYCTRYRVAARSANTPDSCAGNIGFRVASS